MRLTSVLLLQKGGISNVRYLIVSTEYRGMYRQNVVTRQLLVAVQVRTPRGTVASIDHCHR